MLFRSDSFTYKADDGLEQSSAATVTINVASVNDVPVANDDSYTVPANETSSISPPGVITNDTDADRDTLTVASHTNTSHGSLIVNVGGSFTYTPFTNYTGPDSFTYTATDGTATSAPATVTINVSPLVGDDLEQYIRGVYQVILGRAPEPSALAYWRAQLAGGLDPAAFTGFLEFSQEAAGDEVAIAYAVILQRPVDPAGLSYWRNLLDNGVTLQDVEATLAGSQEFFNRNGGTNPGAIAQMYRIFLGREPDGGGLVYWTTQLNAGEPRGDVARSLLHSDEGIHRALELAYQVDLHRDVDAQGEAYWRQFLQTGDFRVVLAVLPASYEFAVLVTSG